MAFLQKNKTDNSEANLSFPAPVHEQADFKIPEKQIETLASPETGALGSLDLGEATVTPEKEGLSTSSPQPRIDNTPLPAVKSQRLLQIEKILEEDLGDIFINLDDRQKIIFKNEGEKAARDIDKVLQTGKSVAIKILGILKKWLSVIPGINKFFIEQEAKIKCDKILAQNDLD